MSGVNPKAVIIFILQFYGIIWDKVSRWINEFQKVVTLEQDQKDMSVLLDFRYKRSSLGHLLF